MKRYIKDGFIYYPGTLLNFNGKQYINPSEVQLQQLGFQEVEITLAADNITLDTAKERKIAEIDAYDTSDEINVFYLNKQALWIPRETRVSIMNSTKIQKDLGFDETTLWFNGKSYTLPVDTAIYMLQQLEIYALSCYNVTALHKAAVNRLRSIKTVQAYDYTAGYPEKIYL